MAEWKTGIFGCFSDCRLCILTFCVPCYTIGRNAQEGLGEDCLLVGLLYAIGLNFGPILRWRLRQERNLQGTMITDVAIHLLLPCCGLIQEAKEIGWALPRETQSAGKEVTPADEEMNRQ